MMTKSVHFSLGGYLDGCYNITITIREMGASFLFTPPFRDAEGMIEKVYGDETKKMIHSLYLCNVIDWKKSYDDPQILDGTQWSLEITYKNQSTLKKHGNNAYPPHWSKFMMFINKYSPVKIR